MTDGHVAPGYERVADTFDRIAGRGAAFAAVADGVTVVDLWGGDWQADTPALVFSGTKGVVAVELLLLLERGALTLDTPVADVWPELAVGVREELLVRHVVSHTAGLPGMEERPTRADLLDPSRMAVLLEQQRSWWPPGERLAYHALTWGWLCAELIRRADGRSAGVLLAEEVSRPLGLDLWLGAPPGVAGRAARLAPAEGHAPTFLGDDTAALEDVYCGLLGEFPWNDTDVLAAEIPAVNAVGTARSIARLYGCLARGGEIDGTRLLREDTVALGRTELSRGDCEITRRPYAFGVGFELQAVSALGPPADAFGHTGAGGSSHGAWPSQRVGFSFVPAELRPEESDSRARELLDALDAAVRS